MGKAFDVLDDDRGDHGNHDDYCDDEGDPFLHCLQTMEDDDNSNA